MPPEAAWIQGIRDRLQPDPNQERDGGDPSVPELWDDPFRSENGFEPDVPPSDAFSMKRLPQGEKMMKTLLEVHQLTDKQKDGLWIFDTLNSTHFQLTNYTGDDVRELQGRIRDIQMVFRWGARKLCYDLQVRVFIDTLARKSRGDLKDGLRERPMWGVMNILKYVFGQEPPKPKDNTGWGGMFFNRNRGRY